MKRECRGEKKKNPCVGVRGRASSETSLGASGAGSRLGSGSRPPTSSRGALLLMLMAACLQPIQPARFAPWQRSGPARDWYWSRFLSSCSPVHIALSFTVRARMKIYPQRKLTAPSTVENAQGEQRNAASRGNKKRLGHTSNKCDHALTASPTALSPETAMA